MDRGHMRVAKKKIQLDSDVIPVNLELRLKTRLFFEQQSEVYQHKPATIRLIAIDSDETLGTLTIDLS